MKETKYIKLFEAFVNEAKKTNISPAVNISRTAKKTISRLFKALDFDAPDFAGAEIQDNSIYVDLPIGVDEEGDIKLYIEYDTISNTLVVGSSEEFGGIQPTSETNSIKADDVKGLAKDVALLISYYVEDLKKDGDKEKYAYTKDIYEWFVDATKNL